MPTMRETPADLPPAAIRACLQAEFGLAVGALTFLPLGQDALAWVYRAEDVGGDRAGRRSYFVKVRRGAARAAGLAIPRYLFERGIHGVVAPLPTRTGALAAGVGAYTVTLYPFVAGRTGMAGGLTAPQWRAYGALLRQVHDTPLTPGLAAPLRHETFTPDGAEVVRRLDARIAAADVERSSDGPEDQIAATLATTWRARRPTIRELLARADAFGRQLAAAAPPSVLCHADIHTNNLLIDRNGQVRFVDWDETMAAPRERDLMFVVGGIAPGLVRPAETARFFEGYGAWPGAEAEVPNGVPADLSNAEPPGSPTDAPNGALGVDPLALAYYRCAWAISDIGAYGEQVLERPDLGPASRAAALTRFGRLFAPGYIVEIALGSPHPRAAGPPATTAPQPGVP